MHILLTGGGTGGHIIPLLAVAHELKELDASVKLSYVGERGGKFADLTRNNELIDNRYAIYAGKFRRYHNESLFRKLLDFRTNYLNIRDCLFVVIGVFQAYFLLRRIRPDIIFIKGGYVGVPIGLAAALLKIPYVTHDSDAIPGLANKMISKWAQAHATGMSKTLYPYPQEKTVCVGVPVASTFYPVTTKRMQEAKKILGLPKDAQLVVITGGSQGSQRINETTRSIVNNLLSSHQLLHIVHHVGRGNESAYSGYAHPRLNIEPFIDKFVTVATAADVVVTRGGANSLAELGILGKPTIVIPSPFLSGGHQLKNAAHLTEKEAIIELDEVSVQSDPSLLEQAISRLLNDPVASKRLAANLQAATKRNAAHEIATLLLEQQRVAR